MNILKNIIVEILIVVGVIIWSLCDGDQGTIDVFLWGKMGMGTTISSFGILWAVGAIITLSAGWASKFTSLGLAIGLIVLGIAMDMHGLYMAIAVLGGYILFVAYLCGAVSPSLSVILWVIGFCLILIGYPQRHLSAPTQVSKDIWCQTLLEAQAEHSPILKDCENLTERDRAILREISK